MKQVLIKALKADAPNERYEDFRLNTLGVVISVGQNSEILIPWGSGRVLEVYTNESLAIDHPSL